MQGSAAVDPVSAAWHVSNRDSTIPAQCSVRASNRVSRREWFAYRKPVMPRYRLVRPCAAATLMVAVLCPVATLRSQGADTIRVEDIVAGIESRDSNLQSFALEYQFFTERTDAFYREQRLKELLTGGEPPADALEAVRSTEFHEELVDETRESTEAYEILASVDGKVASITYDADKLREGVRQKTLRIVWDGVTARSLSYTGLTGGFGPSVREDCMPSRTPEAFFFVDGRPLVELLRSENTEVQATRIDGGDILCDVRYEWSTNSDFFSLFTDITFNMSKSVWPVSVITCKLLADDREVVRSSLEVEEFWKSGSFYYPRSMIRRTFSEFPDDESSVAVVEKCVVDRFELDPALGDADFALEFPNGSAYLDMESGERFYVTEEGDVIDREEKARRLKAEFLGDDGALKAPRRSFGTIRVLLVAASIALFCFAAASFCLRKFRKK